jgi:glutamate racemase
MIGIFDSGIGGISILNAITRRLPGAHCSYLADTEFFPYGQKTRENIIERSIETTRFLLDEGARIIVIACNSATGAAIAELRRTFPVPFVGVEPAIKVARRHLISGPIGVLCTDLTSSGEKYRDLMESQGLHDRVITRASPSLADVIEKGELQGEPLREYLVRQVEPFRRARVGCLVLGCTHYAFVRDEIQRILGVPVLEPAEAVADHALSLYSPEAINGRPGETLFFTTGSMDSVRSRAEALIERPPVAWTRTRLEALAPLGV